MYTLREFFKAVWEWLDTWDVRGDYVEFGVAAGHSLGLAWVGLRAARLDYLNDQEMMAILARRGRWPERRFFGFDSFQGLPAMEGVDANPVWRPGDYGCSRERVTANLESIGIPLTEVELVAGPFERTLRQREPRHYDIDRAALVVVDVDLYGSTVEALDFIAPALDTGSVIVFDDYFAFRGDPARGEARAFREFQERHPYLRFELWQQIELYERAYLTTRLE